MYLEHLSHFSLKSLAALLRAADMEVLALERADFRLPGPRLHKVLWAAARPRPQARRQAPDPSPPESVFAALETYLAASRASPALERLASLARTRRPLWVWGLSQLTLFLINSSPLGDCELAGFIDADPFKRSRRLLGRPVFPPEILRGRPAGEAVFLAAWGHEAAMKARLTQMAFPGQVFTLLENCRD